MSLPGAAVARSQRVVPRRGRIQNSPANTAQSSAGRPATLSHPSPAAADASTAAAGSTIAGGSGDRTSEYAASAPTITTASCPAPSPKATRVGSVEAVGELDLIHAATPLCAFAE